MTKKLKVLIAGAEVAPFAKVGGLGDVLGSLPPALKKLKIDVRVVMPLYGSIDKKKYKLKKIYSDLEVPSGIMMIKINIWETALPGTKVKIYFIDCPEYFKYKEVYAPGDNSERFLFFSFALLYAIPIIKFKPDVIHLQDSHVALVPDILKSMSFKFFKGIKTLYTIHNFRYQGKTDPIILSTGNLTAKSTKSLSKDIQDGDLNFMQQGVMTADLINTVSPTYAKEITTSFYGAGLEKIVRKRKKDLFGIVNGIDTNLFDPKKDKLIYKNFSVKSLNKKQDNKTYLQKKAGLPIDKSIPLIGVVTRLAWQKGLELITKRFTRFNAQFIFLGTGAPEYEKQLSKLAKDYPKQFSAQIMFDLKFAQQIYAGSDIFLMPSRYEPCGLGQLIAMRYGTLPLVRATGGLADTVDNKVGFSFKKMSKTELFDTLKIALDIYFEKPDKWQKMQVEAMTRDFSWDKSAKEYLQLYKKLMK